MSAAPTTHTYPLTAPITSAPGVGLRRAEAFQRLGIRCIAHLIDHLPFRHELEQAEGAIADLTPGHVGAARGEITACRVVRKKRGGRFEAVLIDHTGRLDLVWFNQPFLASRIMPGMRVRVQGKAERRGPMLQMANPHWEALPDVGAEPGARAERLRPVYPATEDLPSHVIDKAVQGVLHGALAQLEDHLPEGFRRERELPSLAAAYRMMHAPEHEDEVKAARRRLVYDELLMLQLGVQMRRAQLRAMMKAPALETNPKIDAHIRKRLPFALTPAQDHVVQQIASDLAKTSPANRLIQGDVGSGKTVVALYALLLAVAHGAQGVLLAPTELLAEQHFHTISSMLKASRVRLALLTGSRDASTRAAEAERIASGEIDIAIGTHALLTEHVRFHNLAVAIIDEQHRFGVHQRAALRAKMDDETTAPHTLVMTATPIPRTLALTVFGDLDVSTIDGLPPGRQPVATRWVRPPQTEEVWDFVRTRIDQGEQAYVVLPAIGEDDDDAELFDEGAPRASLRSVRSTLAQLSQGVLAGKRLAVMHGRLSRDEREATMQRFRAGEIDCLIATTVIEVGVDIPNASIMVIDHADRFGLAQLHQLRGRIGRGERKGVCILIAEPSTEDGAARLNAIVRTTDGFALAEEDLKLRGPGELIGSKQSGQLPLRLTQLPRDQDLLMQARRDAARWIEQSPTLSRPEEKVLHTRLWKRYGSTLGLVDVA
ncbi:MAG: ATP-dependent DNA helicase RecG [Phycisphaerales bacterium]|nr:ATP-dependent DNA helicase RecG [Phycisphaerales bacterium]